MAVGGEEKKSVLPVLDCYLTFIHYFGFSINPTDDGNTRYLSVRVKRRRRRRRRAAGQASQNNQQQQQTSEEAGGEHGDQADQWRASYRRRAQRTVCSLPPPLIRLLKISVKFTAIVFTTFIALNHCIVLADYIYQGSKVFLELMLEVRLVITKFSALIFVLSWHFSQTKVRQLIKLVKSTSVYIIGTQSIWLPAEPLHVGGNSTQLVLGSGEQRARAEPILSADAIKRCLEEQRRLVSMRRRRAACQHLGTNEADSRYTHENVLANGRDEEEAASFDQTNGAGKTGGPGERMDEIGDTLLTNINYMDRRFLRWWLMCVCVSILHFGLSEAELSKSHHLWQWLDDYSLHQFNNQTIGETTLLFLASFDNYIYTVHVYGTRLIGASIICIVCSLQRENIKSLRWNALKLIQRCSPESPVVARPNQLSSHRCSSFHASARAPNQLGPVNAKQTRQQQQQQPRAWFVGASNNNDDDDDELTACDCDCDFDNDFELGLESELAGASCQRRKSRMKRYDSCTNKERDLFFVLGESDWLRVHECARNCRPSGYLSSALHWASRSFISQLAGSAGRLWAQKVCGTQAAARGLFAGAIRMTPSNRVGASGRAAGIAQQNMAPDGRGDSCRQQAPSLPATPTLTPSPVTSLDQVADCNSRDDDRPGGRNGPQNWPTPNATTTTEQSSQANHRCKVLAADESINGYGRDHSVERQLERLASKYELVRTVNARIDSCFGPMLLIQFSFLFLMSCIDVVYFSICFNPNTKTKYIIVSGMILLWWPYLLLYKFASDIGAESKELLISVRRLARLWLLEHHNCCLANNSNRSPKPAEHDDRCSPWRLPSYGRGNYPMASFDLGGWRYQARAKCGANNNNNNTDLTHCYSHDRSDFSHPPPPPTVAQNRDKTLSLDDGQWPLKDWPLTKRFWPHYSTSTFIRSKWGATSGGDQSSSHGSKARACIINKLDHVFKPTYLSIMGIMTVDKFFLLNFAKIVITASVMIIQFIT